MSATETIPTANDARGAHSLRRFVRGHNHVTLYLGDCLEIAPTLTGVDAIISDPPYGMNLDTDNSRFSGGNTASIARRGNGIGTGGGAGIIGDAEPFDPTPWLDYPAVVLFGSNHYAQRLPVGTTLVWLKRHDAGFGSFLSDAELAWMKGGHGVYAKRDLSMNGEALTRCHPCQKPVPLMAWAMERAKVPAGATVLDPYMGSASTGMACLRTGRNFVGIEIDPEHFKTACARLERECNQGALL
jgi:site-specific DNA-methyltransferase (adenine-specific)